MKELMRKTMEKLGASITAMPVKVKELNPVMGIGCSYRHKKEAEIMIAFQYPFPEPPKAGEDIILYGVFTHEILHILRTDFSYLEKRINDFPASERKVRKDVWNIMEDPAIEYLGSYMLSDFLNGCLDQSIRYLYENGTPVDEKEDPFQQVICAMIHFGDLGVVKGHFTFPEAREAFIKIMPLMQECIEEPDPKKRFEIAQEAFEVLRPLWEEYEKRDDALSSLQNLLNGFGKSSNSGGEGEPVDSSDFPSQDQSPANQNRKELLRKIKEGQVSVTPPSDDAGNASGVDSLESFFNQKLLSMGDTPDPEKVDVIREAIKIVEKNRKLKEDDDGPDLVSEKNIRVKSPYYGNVPYSVCEAPKGEDYSLDEDLNRQVVNLRSELRKIFRDRHNRKEYHNSGKVNIKRASGRKLTARIFEKRTMQDDKSDLAISILLDLSSSMRGNIGYVVNSCTLLLEALKTFPVPVKVTGFWSSDTDNKYTSFGNWKNTDNLRRSIHGISVHGQTFLGHAIRYAGELLKRRPESHKLLICITDGLPCSSHYKSSEDGMDDCRFAVNEIRKYAGVIGLGLFKTDDEKELFRYIFQQDSLSMVDMSAMNRELARKLKKFLRSY